MVRNTKKPACFESKDRVHQPGLFSTLFKVAASRPAQMTTGRLPIPATANLSSRPLAPAVAAWEWEHRAVSRIRTFVPSGMPWSRARSSPPRFRCSGRLRRPRGGKIPPAMACNATAKLVSEPPIAGGPRPAGLVFPETRPDKDIAALAQLVEHIIRNDGVVGSNPIGGTTFPSKDVR